MLAAGPSFVCQCALRNFCTYIATLSILFCLTRYYSKARYHTAAT